MGTPTSSQIKHHFFPAIVPSRRSLDRRTLPYLVPLDKAPQLVEMCEAHFNLSKKRKNSIYNHLTEWSNKKLASAIAESLVQITHYYEDKAYTYAEHETLALYPLLSVYCDRGLWGSMEFYALNSIIADILGGQQVMTVQSDFIVLIAQWLAMVDNIYPNMYSVGDIVFAIWNVNLKGMETNPIEASLDIHVTHPEGNDPLYSGMLDHFLSPFSMTFRVVFEDVLGKPLAEDWPDPDFELPYLRTSIIGEQFIWTQTGWKYATQAEASAAHQNWLSLRQSNQRKLSSVDGDTIYVAITSYDNAVLRSRWIT